MLIPLMDLEPGPELRTGAAQFVDGYGWHGGSIAILAVSERLPQAFERLEAEDPRAAEQPVCVARRGWHVERFLLEEVDRPLGAFQVFAHQIERQLGSDVGFEQSHE